MSADLSYTEFTAIVAAGIQAPSAENHHPIEFEQEGRGIALWATPEHQGAAPHRKLLNLIAFGAVAENMCLYALTVGWRAHLEVYLPQHPDQGRLARLNLERCEPEQSSLAAAIFERHTNRHFFRGPVIPIESQQAIESDVAAVPGAALHWFNDRPGKRKIANLVRLTESARFRTPPLSDELFGSIRFDVGWKGTCDDGLPPGALGIERPLRPAFAALRYRPILKALNAVGGHHVLGVRAGYAPCVLAPGIAVLSHKSDDVEQGCWVVGRALERLWLRATVLGLAVQPFIAPGLYAIDCYPAVPSKLRRHLAQSWAALIPESQPLAVLRLGRAARPAMRTGRREAPTYVRHGAGPHEPIERSS